MPKNKEISELAKEIADLESKKLQFEKDMAQSFSAYYQGLKKEKLIRKDILEYIKKIKENEDKIKSGKLDGKEKKVLRELNLQYQDMLNKSQTLVNNINKSAAASQLLSNKWKETRTLIGDTGKSFLKDVFSVIDATDGLIKKQNLKLGITNDLTNTYGTSLNNVATLLANIGLRTEDLVNIQGTFVNTTGRLTQLNQQNFKDIGAIAAGTGMGAEAASKMVGEFQLLGYGIKESRDIIQETVDNVGKYGISSGKLLTKVNENLNKLNTYNFKNGVKGLIEMTKFSERFGTDMQGAFNAMDKARTLEGSIDMAAQLMVMGGNFAKADPFKMSFLARNDPAKFTEELTKMNDGIAVFSKTTGAFEIGAYDLDRLRQVAAATGQDFDKLTAGIKQAATFKMAKSQIFAGTEEQRKMVATMAQIGKDGKFSIDIGEKHFDDISKLTATDMKMLEQQNKTLERRAEDATNWQDTLSNLSAELKYTLLPLMKFSVEILKKVHSAIDATRSIFGTLRPFVYALLGLGAFFKAGTFIKTMSMLGGGNMFKGMGKSIYDKFTFANVGKNTAVQYATPAGSPLPPNTPESITNQSTTKNIAANYSMAASIAAIGVAAVGIGYGLKLATDGFSNLAIAMKGMPVNELNTLLSSMGIIVGGFTIALVGSIIAIGTASSFTAPGLLALGAAAVGVGAGIWLAANGAAALVTALNTLNSTETSLNSINPTVNTSGVSANIEELKKLKEELNSLSNTTFAKTINELNSVLSKGVEMRIAKGTELVINNTFQIDGERFNKKNHAIVTQKQATISINKESKEIYN